MKLGQARKRAEVAAAGQEYMHGRRPTNTGVVAEVKRLGDEGLSQRKIAAATGLSLGTVNKYLAA